LLTQEEIYQVKNKEDDVLSKFLPPYLITNEQENVAKNNESK